MARQHFFCQNSVEMTICIGGIAQFKYFELRFVTLSMKCMAKSHHAKNYMHFCGEYCFAINHFAFTKHSGINALLIEHCDVLHMFFRFSGLKCKNVNK